MFKKIFSLILIFCVCGPLFAEEVLPDLSENSTAPLNEALRKNSNNIASTKATLASMNILNTTGDLLTKNGSVYSRIPAGTSGYFLKSNGVGTIPSYAAIVTANAGQTSNITAVSDFTTTTLTGTYQDVTGISVTRTIASTSVLILMEGMMTSGDGADQYGLTINAAGADLATGTNGIINANGSTGVPYRINIHALATSLTPGINTFKLQVKLITGSNEAKFLLSGGYQWNVTVIEL